MNGLLNRLYGFDEFGFGTDGAAFGFAFAPPLWIWLAVIAAAVALAGAVYTRGAMRPIARWSAGFCRAALLVALAFLAFGPRLEKPRTRVSEDRVLYLVDRSESMTVTDGAGPTRDDQLRGLLSTHDETLRAVAVSKDTRWYGFGDSVSPMGSESEEVPTIADPAGSATRLGPALDALIAENAGQPLSAIVLFSDGRATEPVSRGTRAALSQAGVPVIAVPLGSPDRAPDIALEGAEAPAVAYVNDTVPVVVSLGIGTSGDESGEGAGENPGGLVEVVETATGRVLESAPLSAEDFARGEATLPVKLDRAGEANWTVRVVPDGPDLSSTNNETSLSIRFVDDPIRVLYVDGSPRWEQRYLKTMLIREESIDASCLLLAADRRFQQEGNTVLATLPSDEDGWDAFDLVILGDLRPELIGERAARAIRTQVGERSTGLLWLAGPSANPHAWGDSPASDLLPVRIGSSASVLPIWGEPVVFSTTPASDRLGLFRELTEAEGVTRADAGWSRLRWALQISPDLIKPSAELFAVAAPDASAGGSPLVLGMRYGSGRSALVATDEIWRWRYGRGESATERFWLPLIRHLARPRLASLGSGARLDVSSALVPVGQQVVVELTVTDRASAEVLPDELRAEASPLPPSRDEPTAITLIRETSGAGVARYRGAFTPVRTGPVTVRLSGDSLLPEGLTRRIDVVSLDDELRSPQTDHGLLASLAADTGGRMLAADAFDRLPAVLPNRRVIAPLPPETRTLWDHPAPLALLLVVASAEWIIRRRSRLA